VEPGVCDDKEEQLAHGLKRSEHSCSSFCYRDRQPSAGMSKWKT